MTLQVLKVASLNTLRRSASLYLAQKIGADVFKIIKFDNTGDLQTSYTIRNADGGKSTVCDCPAYVDNCRHKKILSNMIRFGGLNNPNKVIVTDGKSMAWLELESGEPIFDPMFFGGEGI